MKTKILFLMLVLLACTTSLPALTTREQADEIVRNHLQSEATLSGVLYANVDEPAGESIAITTSNGESFTAQYACWVYCFKENTLRRYLFVAEDDGSLLEVIANNDISVLNSSWQEIDYMPTGLAALESNVQSLYPNPVDDWLTVPCNGESVRVEIYDLKGTRLFSGTLSGEDACRLNVSFLNAGVYMLNVSGENYKIIKN